MLLEKKKKNTFVAENAENTEGEMLEWLKRHAWKACIRDNRIEGSNPSFSASCVHNTMCCARGVFGGVFIIVTIS